MITLNDYLYNGDTVFKILKRYTEDLKTEAVDEENAIDIVHCNYLTQLLELLEHNDFLTAQSQRLREFYHFMADKYPFLAFTFKGRIKSLIRAEEKFNGKIVSYMYDYYAENKTFPGVSDIKQHLNLFHDLIAYRIVISLPRCHLKAGDNRQDLELQYLYEIANIMPDFLEMRNFTAEVQDNKGKSFSPLIKDDVKNYYEDYIINTSSSGYKSLHITFYDTISRSFIEVQLRTKDMDDYAEIGPANHSGYEKKQEAERSRIEEVPMGVNRYFDEAYRRVRELQLLDLSTIDVNMFSAVNNSLINDGCGLFRGRLILPYEHLSRFQNDLIG